MLRQNQNNTWSKIMKAASSRRTPKESFMSSLTMTLAVSIRGMVMAVCLASVALAQTSVTIKPGRDPKQPIDEEYTRKIREYTTETFFNSPLTDYLPASKTVPTPKAVLGDVAGAPGKLPYSKEVYRYMRM